MERVTFMSRINFEQRTRVLQDNDLVHVQKGTNLIYFIL